MAIFSLPHRQVACLDAGPVNQIVQDAARSRRFYATPQIGGLWRVDFMP
jgi:hypothetical protein